MVAPHSTRRSSTSGAHRYSSGRRSNASSSGVVPSSSAASVYSARAWPISFWAIEENATSSSRNGAIPVHSELRQPRISSSSAISSSSCARSLTCLPQLLLERITVDAVVVAPELVDEVVDLEHVVARHDPQCDGFAAAAVLLPRVRLREVAVRRRDGARMLERLALALLPEDLENHQAASASTTSRTHAEFSRAARRRSSRSAVFGPWPVTTARSSSQSGSVYSHTPSSFLRSSGSGTVRPSSQTCGT